MNDLIQTLCLKNSMCPKAKPLSWSHIAPYWHNENESLKLSIPKSLDFIVDEKSVSLLWEEKKKYRVVSSWKQWTVSFISRIVCFRKNTHCHTPFVHTSTGQVQLPVTLAYLCFNWIAPWQVVQPCLSHVWQNSQGSWKNVIKNCLFWCKNIKSMHRFFNMNFGSSFV